MQLPGLSVSFPYINFALLKRQNYVKIQVMIATICKDAFFYETIRLSSVANSWSGSIGFDRCAFNPACMLR
jgi:hypothetical protein